MSHQVEVLQAQPITLGGCGVKIDQGHLNLTLAHRHLVQLFPAPLRQLSQLFRRIWPLWDDDQNWLWWTCFSKDVFQADCGWVQISDSQRPGDKRLHCAGQPLGTKGLKCNFAMYFCLNYVLKEDKYYCELLTLNNQPTWNANTLWKAVTALETWTGRSTVCPSLPPAENPFQTLSSSSCKLSASLGKFTFNRFTACLLVSPTQADTDQVRSLIQIQYILFAF